MARTSKLGNKGFNLKQMEKLGLNVPPNFILQKKSETNMLTKQIGRLEKQTGKIFGNKKNPLLVSVRSSPRVSMPGMLDTVLNVGTMGKLKKAVNDVFNSWNSARAKKMRTINNISEKLGTAVIVQAMVFGNLKKESCSGVFYNRHPLTGATKAYGEYLEGEQGEAIVGGTKNGKQINELAKKFKKNYKELKQAAKKLDAHFSHVQEIEFTIENGKLWLLQTRDAKLEATAKIKIAIDMVREKTITKKQAVQQCEGLLEIATTKIARTSNAKPFAKGLSASSGAVKGRAYFNIADAVEAKGRGEKVILVRSQTSPKDVAGIAASDGILTARGGKTSHAAIIARGLGKPCIVGALTIKIENKTATSNGKKIKQGDVLTLDASGGNVYLGEQKIIKQKPSKNEEIILHWKKQNQCSK